MKATLRALTTINEGGNYYYAFDTFVIDAPKERIDALVESKQAELVEAESKPPAAKPTKKGG